MEELVQHFYCGSIKFEIKMIRLHNEKDMYFEVNKVKLFEKNLIKYLIFLLT